MCTLSVVYVDHYMCVPLALTTAGTNMTEWEWQKEKEEFSRAARVYQPLSTSLESRFQPEGEGPNKEQEVRMDKHGCLPLCVTHTSWEA